MRAAFVVFIRALGLYALLTIPTLFLPVIYLISMIYVITYGWFAWALFSCIYLLVRKTKLEFHSKQGILYLGVVVSVLFAFQMLEILGTEDNIWDAGGFLFFPVIACIAGWISLTISFSKEVGFLGTVTKENEEPNLPE